MTIGDGRRGWGRQGGEQRKNIYLNKINKKIIQAKTKETFYLFLFVTLEKNKIFNTIKQAR